MNQTIKLFCSALAVTALPLSACGGDDSDAMGTPATSTTGEQTQQSGSTLCAKYGGAGVVDEVVRNNVLGTIAEDCRINAFFTMLSEDAFVRVEDCLSLQVQELFGCEGVKYQGAEASNGLPCRSMALAHQGLGISSADFNALIEDVVGGLSDAGVEEADIQAAAPALLGMEGDIVEAPEGDITEDACMLGSDGGQAQ